MKLLPFLYIINATLLLLHEIESAYEKEWEILKLPGQITGFLLLHIPIVFLLFYGALEIQQKTTIGLTLGVILGISGIIPALVHKLLIKTPDQFNQPISNLIIYGNIPVGIGLLAASIGSFL